MRRKPVPYDVPYSISNAASGSLFADPGLRGDHWRKALWSRW
jgi:hypothetical protein